MARRGFQSGEAGGEGGVEEGLGGELQEGMVGFEEEGGEVRVAGWSIHHLIHILLVGEGGIDRREEGWNDRRKEGQGQRHKRV